jgi:hypothetical protein
MQTNLSGKCPVQKSSFLFNNLVGVGGFGKVYSTVLVKNRNWYALKEINKYKLLKVNHNYFIAWLLMLFIA